MGEKKSKLNENLLFLIWVQSVLALAGSLYYSEIMGFIPCEFCWIQRIFMYPLVVIYGIAAIKKDMSIALPGLIMSGAGLMVSIYHYLVQKVPAFQAAGDACGMVPCNVEYVNYLGFITIPFLAGLSFIIIFVLHLIILTQSRRK